MAAEETYFTANGGGQDNPVVYRGKYKSDNYAKADYPYLISIYWLYNSVSKGMPDKETYQLQTEFEDLLVHLDQENIGHLILVRTANGQRVWHWYVKDNVDWMNRFNLALEDHPRFPIEIEIEHQPDWDFYQQFMDQLQSPETEAASDQ